MQIHRKPKEEMEYKLEIQHNRDQIKRSNQCNHHLRLLHFPMNPFLIEFSEFRCDG
ncbi:hypothetical protein Scep_010340 [Stephania cephalantha]|uniref:Uncharacterized protein n=1 Tax=Stephania cephalantha TaxID=152367 RepID=A0AAP0JVM5_9MAGN